MPKLLDHVPPRLQQVLVPFSLHEDDEVVIMIVSFELSARSGEITNGTTKEKRARDRGSPCLVPTPG